MKKRIILGIITFTLVILFVSPIIKKANAATSYALTLNARGGRINGQSTMTVYVNAGSIIYNTANGFSVSKSGTSFIGWYYDQALSNPLGKSDVMTKDTTLYAKYNDDIITYTITLNANGGRNYNGNTISYASIESGSYITAALSSLSPQNRSGYTFIGWFYDSALNRAVKSTDKLTSDLTLYAGWAANAYELIWNPNGGYFK